MSNYLPLNDKYIGNLKSLYLKWHWSFSLEIFEKVLLGLTSLYHIQMKSSKTIYLTEQCQLMSHRNSVHSVRRITKLSKMSCPLRRNLTVYSIMHLKLKHVLTTFLSFCQRNAIQMHKCKFVCPKCTFKSKLLIRKCWFRPLIRFYHCHSLLFDSIS